MEGKGRKRTKKGMNGKRIREEKLRVWTREISPSRKTVALRPAEFPPQVTNAAGAKLWKKQDGRTSRQIDR